MTMITRKQFLRSSAVAGGLGVRRAAPDRDVIVIEARGDTEPLVLRQYNPEAQTLNRRVEIKYTN